MSSLKLAPGPANMLPRTPIYRYLGLAVLLVCVWLLGPALTGASIKELGAVSRRPSASDSEPDSATWVKEVLSTAGVGPEISYAARTLKYIPDAEERLSITEVDQDLFPDKFVDLKVSGSTRLPAGTPLNVHVKEIVRPGAVDASSLIFGVSTTYSRFSSETSGPVEEWTRWLTDGHGHSNGAGLVLALFNTTQEDMDRAYERLISVGINATVVPSSTSLDMAGRYVDLVQMLWNDPSRNHRKYFVLADDDTFFPYMSSLLSTISKYNPKKPYYIGTFTERGDWMLNNHAPMAYGGGGIFLTAPVVRQLVKLPCLQKNDDGGYALGGDQGDRLLYNCLHKHTEVTLTYLPSLNQEDQFGDPSGFYESGRKHLSLHHYKSWHHVEPAKIHQVADACGEDCVMQRFQFKDNFIISNGYSVAEYPQGITFDAEQVEGTFGLSDPDSDIKDVVHSYAFGELRKDLTKTGRKRAWEILDTRTEASGTVVQVYLKNHMDDRWVAEGEEKPALDSIVVLTWKP